MRCFLAGRMRVVEVEDGAMKGHYEEVKNNGINRTTAPRPPTYEELERNS